MKSSAKIIIFFIIFSIGFYLLRTQGYYVYYNVETLVANLGGLTYLYSTIGIIFAIFAAFVVFSETERWNNLVKAVRGEVGELNELRLWSQHLPGSLKVLLDNAIEQYLETLVGEGWGIEASGQKSHKIEIALDSLHDCVYKLSKEAPDLMTEIFSTLADLIKYREERVHYISFHLPKILKNALLFSYGLLVVFSLFIGVHDVWLDYIFVLGIALLGYLIYLLVDDLDNPTRPGGWHITTKDYQELLSRFRP